MALIDKHKARKAIHDHNPAGKLLRRETVLKLLGQLPEVDPVHAAGGCYCRTCEYWADDEQCPMLSMMSFTEPEMFCSYGRRREGADG